MSRQEYRALGIMTNSLKQAKHRNHMDSTQSSFHAESNDLPSEIESEEDVDEMNDDPNTKSQAQLSEVKLGSSHPQVQKIKLPNTLLSGPLPGNKALLLSRKEKRIYNIQKQKWQQKTKQLEKISKSDPDKLPESKTFRMAEARQLVKGIFKHADDEEEADKPFAPINLGD
mmetsp:Transcript_27219/g.33858  ORF Transcript_27219/g.33858 Transcript_27219/m.33858 type:complete len:171 (+) Transcript_27219:607-1119(+)